jgi:death-on-curing protein
MKAPVWLGREVVLAIQGELLARFGGLNGLRDDGLLESALARPRQMYRYGKSGLFDLAAGYAHGIVKNHPFLDGNKRVGFMAAYTFLGINGYRLEAPEEQAALQTIALAAGEVDADGYAAWLKQSSARR